MLFLFKLVLRAFLLNLRPGLLLLLCELLLLRSVSRFRIESDPCMAVVEDACKLWVHMCLSYHRLSVM